MQAKVLLFLNTHNTHLGPAKQMLLEKVLCLIFTLRQ